MKLSDTEWTVMHAVWTRGRATAREVLSDVGEETSWAYTTVKTILDRLVEKGALAADRSRTATEYSARVTRDKARRSAVRRLVDRAFSGSFGPLLLDLVREERLTDGEREELRKLLEEEDA